MARPQEGTTPARAAAMAAQGREIQRARLSRGLSQRQAVAALGIPLGTLRAWEIGRRGCPPEMRMRLAEEWGADREVLALTKDNACPCCGRPYDETARRRRPKEPRP
jgi:hypothetical protein